MLRLDLAFFYRLGAVISQLRTLRADTHLAGAGYTLSNTRSWLEVLRDDQALGPALRTSKAPLNALIQRIDAILMRSEDGQLTFSDVSDLLGDFNRYEAVLTSELAVADAYFVLEKKPYNTLTLVTDGPSLFPPSLPLKVPEAWRDMLDAGKCLAFEVPTAAAFHIHRATEAVLRRYWTAVTGNATKPKLRTIGVYLAAMKQHGLGDSKVRAALTQMNELHRNPTIHPGDVLDTEGAIALIGIANSVVAAMLKEIPNIEPEQPNLAFPPLGGDDRN